MTLSKFEKCEWPYNSQAARTITCYVTKAPRAKLYIWHDGPFDGSWNYTMSAGRNSERSHSGRVAKGRAVVTTMDTNKRRPKTMKAPKTIKLNMELIQSNLRQWAREDRKKKRGAK